MDTPTLLIKKIDEQIERLRVEYKEKPSLRKITLRRANLLKRLRKHQEHMVAGGGSMAGVGERA